MISVTLNREELAAAVLFYIERRTGELIDPNDVGYTMQLHVDAEGQIESLDASFFKAQVPA